MNGILLIDKPKGWTSFDVVAKVRGIIRAQSKALGFSGKVKVGHTGTLDPLATGLLVLCIGTYTKKVTELTAHTKRYEAVVTLGKTSTTDDAEGNLIAGLNSSIPTDRELQAVLATFEGEIEQVPPAFSALKINGKRAYDLARAGKPVELKKRKITIFELSSVDYHYPEVRFEALVSSGTYIRSLARDIGEALGTGAYLSDLRRTMVGEFSLDDAIAVDLLDYGTIEQSLLA